VLSDFSAGTFHNRPAHDLKNTSTRPDGFSRATIIPDIHRGGQNRALRAAILGVTGMVPQGPETAESAPVPTGDPPFF